MKFDASDRAFKAFADALGKAWSPKPPEPAPAPRAEPVGSPGAVVDDATETHHRPIPRALSRRSRPG